MNRHATPFKSRLNEHRQTSRQIADKSSPIQCHESFYCWHLHVCTHAAAFWFYTRYTQTAYTPLPPLPPPLAPPHLPCTFLRPPSTLGSALRSSSEKPDARSAQHMLRQPTGTGCTTDKHCMCKVRSYLSISKVNQLVPDLCSHSIQPDLHSHSIQSGEWY